MKVAAALDIFNHWW